ADPIVVPALAAGQTDFGFESPETAVAPPLSNIAPIMRIVDPSVADEQDEPLFGPNHYDDRRQKGGGWLSLFGRPRQEGAARPPVAPTRSGGGAQTALAPVEDVEVDEREDLEIPSFLRRLAN
ncbi:MAG: cell division protein FtsZ, partial [Caulobacteraceae bacterium]